MSFVARNLLSKKKRYERNYIGLWTDSSKKGEEMTRIWRLYPSLINILILSRFLMGWDAPFLEVSFRDDDHLPAFLGGKSPVGTRGIDCLEVGVPGTSRQRKMEGLAQLAHGKTEDKLDVFSKFPCLKFFQGPHVSKQCWKKWHVSWISLVQISVAICWTVSVSFQRIQVLICNFNNLYHPTENGGSQWGKHPAKPLEIQWLNHCN